jgi:hypothetical protein
MFESRQVGTSLNNFSEASFNISINFFSVLIFWYFSPAPALCGDQGKSTKKNIDLLITFLLKKVIFKDYFSFCSFPMYHFVDSSSISSIRLTILYASPRYPSSSNKDSYNCSVTLVKYSSLLFLL